VAPRLRLGLGPVRCPFPDRTFYTRLVARGKPKKVALIAATYADRFDSFDGQRFERLESLAGRRGWVVKTQLVRANGERVNLDYYFNAGSVFNVVADGVSDLSLRRADYNSIIKQEGYDALIRDIRENIAEMSGDGQGGIR